jgi:hypothetical protein
LAAVDEDGQVTRRRVPVSSLPAQVRDELGAFVSHRLLTVSDGSGADPNSASGPVLDLAHEQILTAWLPLAAAVSAQKDKLRLRTTAADAAEDWRRHGHPASHLWELGRATTTAAVLDPADLAPDTQAFLAASRRHGQARRRRATAILTTLLLLVTIGAVVAVIQRGIAVEQREQAVRQQMLATARGLTAQAEQARGSDILRALRLNLAAERLASMPGS